MHQSSTSTASVPVHTFPCAWRRERRLLDEAPVGRRTGWRRTRIGRGSGRAPARWRGGAAELVVVRVEDVDVGRRRKVRVELEAEQAAIPEVVDLRPKVGERRRRRVREVVEHLHESALLGDEDTSVGGESDIGRLRQAREDDRLVESGRQRRRATDGRRRETEERRGHERSRREGAQQHGATGTMRPGPTLRHPRYCCIRHPPRTVQRYPHRTRPKRGGPQDLRGVFRASARPRSDCLPVALRAGRWPRSGGAPPSPRRRR